MTTDAPSGYLACVHCGLCHQACPTYVELGTEADSPRGRIQLMRAVDEGRLASDDPEVREHLDLCLGCRACETACPSGVPYGELIEQARARIEEARSPLHRMLRWALARILTSRAGLVPLRLVARLPGRRAVARATGSEWLAFAAALPAPPRSVLPSVLAPDAAPRGTALLLTGCVTDALFGDVNRHAAELLRLAGWHVLVPPAQDCCGALAAHMGAGALAQTQYERVTALMAAHGADVVVSTAAGCGAHLASDGVRDVLAVLGDGGLPPPTQAIAGRVAIHDPCHLVHGQGVHADVRTLLASIPGVELVPLDESDMCCGSAGTYNLTEGSMARRLLDRKLANVARSGAAIVVAANPGCMLQMQSGVIRRGQEVEVRHPLELLASAYGISSSSSTRTPPALPR